MAFDSDFLEAVYQVWNRASDTKMDSTRPEIVKLLKPYAEALLQAHQEKLKRENPWAFDPAPLEDRRSGQ